MKALKTERRDGIGIGKYRVQLFYTTILPNNALLWE